VTVLLSELDTPITTDTPEINVCGMPLIATKIFKIRAYAVLKE